MTCETDRAWACVLSLSASPTHFRLDKPVMQTPLMPAEVVEYVVVTDRSAVDVVDLYPTDGPLSGESTISVPLFVAPPGGVGAARTSLSPTAPGFPSMPETILWSGVLHSPTGELTVSDWSMQPRISVRLRPGPFGLTVTQSDSGTLSLAFVETPPHH